MYDEYRRSVGAYSIDERPVSAAEYERCVAAGKCTRPSCTVAGSAPASCVDLAQAKAYCESEERRLPTEDEWEHAAREATRLGLHGMTDGRLEWTASPYCYFCGKDDEVTRGGPTRNPRLRGWRPPATHDAALGFRCAD
jgi:formylglycine-generating enzyme required for sulfatase activity